jgi:hypothetical protein
MIPIPANVRVLYLGTNATIPAGFVRDTAFDGLYIKACEASATGGGTTGGAESHDHTANPHFHQVSLLGAFDSTLTFKAGTYGAEVDHLHNAVETSTELIPFNWSAVANDPQYYTAIVVNSLGTRGVIQNIAGFGTITLAGLGEKLATRDP